MWSWVTGPVEPGRKCTGCRARLHGEHLVRWTNGSDWHLHCLLDALAARVETAPLPSGWDGIYPP